MLCVCCKDHIHIVLGEGEITKREPAQFGWPIFTQQDVAMTERIVLEQYAENEEGRMKIRELFAKIFRHLKKQGHDKRGHFTSSYLPKTGGGTEVRYASLVEEWFTFAKGEKKNCAYVLSGVPVFNVLVVPLRDCSLIHYVTEPPKELSYREYTWEGRFRVTDSLKIIE